MRNAHLIAVLSFGMLAISIAFHARGPLAGMATIGLVFFVIHLIAGPKRG